MLSSFLAQMRRQWMGALALFLVLTGGVAYAGATITGSDVVDGSLTTADYKNNNIRSSDVRDDTSTGGGLTGADIAADALTADDVNEGTLPFIAGKARAGFYSDSTQDVLLETQLIKISDDGDTDLSKAVVVHNKSVSAALHIMREDSTATVSVPAGNSAEVAVPTGSNVLNFVLVFSGGVALQTINGSVQCGFDADFVGSGALIKPVVVCHSSTSAPPL